MFRAREREREFREFTIYLNATLHDHAGISRFRNFLRRLTSSPLHVALLVNYAIAKPCGALFWINSGR